MPSLEPIHKMSCRRSSASMHRSLDLAHVSRRLSTLSAEERNIDMLNEVDMSSLSTVVVGSDWPDVYPSTQGSSPNTEGLSGATTPTASIPMPEVIDMESITQNDGQVMQIKRQTTTEPSHFPLKGWTTTSKFFYEEIDSHWTAALLIVCFFVSGVTDSVTYQTYSVFTSLQTGNTIFIGLRLSNQPVDRHPFAYVKYIVSVSSYCLGGLFFNVLHRIPTSLSDPTVRLHRWTLFLSFFIQSTLLLVSAALAQSGYVSTEPARGGDHFSSFSSRNPLGHDNFLDLIPMGFLAFEAAGQVCLSRVLLVNDLPTIAISTLYHDLVRDALSTRRLWRARKSKRDFLNGQKKQIRRALCITALFTGAVVGGFVYATPGKLAAALWIAAGSKCLVCIAWCVWPKKVLTETVITRRPDAVEVS